MADIPTLALATLTHERFWTGGWIYERKLDGQRCLAECDGEKVRLLSRTGQDLTATFPEVADALAGQARAKVFLDGEIVAFQGSRTSFQRLQPRIQIHTAKEARRSGVAVFFYAFDVLERDGRDLRQEPLLDRKRVLRSTLTFEGPIRYTPHRVHAGEDWFAECCRRGWEGLIAKRADAAYGRGRTTDWLKFKCEAGQELIVVGWTDPAGSRQSLGALLLGYWDGDDLAYAGKVGTGFSDAELRRLREQLTRLSRSDPAPTRGELPSSGVHWVEPRLVVEIAFTEWTKAGQLRHPRYLGLRTDKDVRDVVQEQ